MNFNVIEEYAKKRGRSMSSIAKKVGKSPSGLKESIKREALPSVDLEVIIDFLEIPIHEVFDGIDQNIVSESTPTYSPKRYLEQRVADIEKKLQKLEKKI